jgi:glycosyltransferase involved in cell wall biosynthesis
MRIGIVLDWNVNASSLMRINQNLFRELGKLMNEKKSFTIAGIKLSSINIGDINQHFDCIHIPNMGGYKFPVDASKLCKNLILGSSGIDEVIYGKEVVVDKSRWTEQKLQIEHELNNWKKYIDKVQSVHVVAKSELQEMNQYLKIPEKKMKIINHGVNHDLFKPSSNKDDTRKEILSKFKLPISKYFIHVGEYNWARKNHLRLIDAYAKARKLGLTHQLIFVGKYHDKIKKEGEKIPGIKFLGWVSDEHLVNLMQSADAFLLPSIHEGFGMPLVESMSCGTPCITTNRHAPPEIVGDAGLFVNPYDTSQIATKMIQIGNDRVLLNKLSQNALVRSKVFSWETNAKKILKLYENIESKPIKIFDDNYDLAAFRTLTTICELFPDSKQFLIESLLQFDYKKMIDWALEYGLKNPQTRDFLKPFEYWLNNPQKTTLIK